MEKIVVRGGVPLKGDVSISGMKNAALPIIFSCVLVKQKCRIENVPNVRDVVYALEILKSLGAKVNWNKADCVVEIDCTDVDGNIEPPKNYVSQMRASYYLIGAELGRFHRAKAPMPGGCNLGERPIDLHLKGFYLLGGEIVSPDYPPQGDENKIFEYVEINAPRGISGASIYLDKVSVGATMNIMIAACLGKGNTIIDNAACEPHIVDLANFLNTCGAKIRGAGTDKITIEGVETLHGCEYSIIPDMIEAGTYMIAVCATGGSARILNVIPKHLEDVGSKLAETGATIEYHDDYVVVKGRSAIRSTNITTKPYPGFPTDMQPQFVALLCKSNGTSYITESVYEADRFQYVTELAAMGADINVDHKVATVDGVKELNGAEVSAVDLRAGAALVIAGLTAKGETRVRDVFRISRGYVDIVGKLKALGADIELVDCPD